jgi:hypothetical protein
VLAKNVGMLKLFYGHILFKDKFGKTLSWMIATLATSQKWKIKKNKNKKNHSSQTMEFYFF